jgi:5-methylcytosine-specific restriction endonuclease McrA
MNPYYPSVARQAGHRCEYCRAPETVFNFPFEVEHFIPGSRGGGDEPGNLCLACRACNLRKSDRLSARDELTQEQVTLFNPRVDDWNDHFRADLPLGQSPA